MADLAAALWILVFPASLGVAIAIGKFLRCCSAPLPNEED